MKIIDSVLNFIYPPFCVGCGTFLDFNREVPLCEKCFEKWETEKNTLCNVCKKKHTECNCMPKEFYKIINSSLHLAGYHSYDCIANKFVITIKNNGYKYVYSYLADELSELLKKRGKSDKNAVITFVPRSKKKIKEYGIDQSEKLSRTISSKINCKCMRLLVHTPKNKEQKTLGASMRRINAEQSYSLVKGVDNIISKKKIILVDDVMTSGSTVLSCAKLLKSAGADEITVLTVARTVYDKIEEE